MSTTQTSNCGKAHKCFHIATLVLLVGAIAASLWAGRQITKMETLKVGGKENFAKLQTIMKSDEYKEQYAQSLDLMLQQLNGGYADDTFSGDDNITMDEPTESGDEMTTTTSTDEGTVDDTINTIDQNETVGE